MFWNKKKIEMKRRIEDLENYVRCLIKQSSEKDKKIKKKDEKILSALDAMITEDSYGFVKVNGKLYQVRVANFRHDIQPYYDSIKMDCVVI